MPIRAEVLADGTIEVMRPRNGGSHFMNFADIDRAMTVIRFLIKKDLAKAASQKFEPQLIKEARKAFKTMQERSPYNGKTS